MPPHTPLLPLPARLPRIRPHRPLHLPLPFPRAAGIASVQQACGQGLDTTGAIGNSGFFARVSCDKEFEYTWFITIQNLAVVVAVIGIVATNTLHKFRAGVIGISAVQVMLLSDVANSFVLINTTSYGSSTFRARARVVSAGSILGTIAFLLITIFVGIFDERAVFSPGSAIREAPKAEPEPVSTNPAEVTYAADAEDPPSV